MATSRIAPQPAHGCAPGGAVAAQPLSTDRPMQVNHPSAARAGRAGDRACSCVAERVDQSQHGRQRRRRSGSGEQIWSILQRPGQAAPLPGLRCHLRRRRGDHLGRQCRIGLRDHVDDQRGRVAPIVGRALRTPRLSIAVAGADASQLPTGRARLATRAADPAVPVLTTTLNRAQPFAALGAHRRRNLGCARLCSAISRSATPRGAGERPSANTPGRSNSA